jgi:hypothetical protein
MTLAKGLHATGTDVVGAMVTVVGVALVIISVVKAILLIPSDVFPLLILLVEKNILILLSLFTPHTITLAESTILTIAVDATAAEVRREDADVKVENLLSSVFVPFLRVRLLSIDCTPQKKVW